MPTTPSAKPPAPGPGPQAVRWFGHYQLLRLLGKSERTMAWRVADPRSGQELMLALPRVQPPNAAALERWQLRARAAARLDHPQLAAVLDSGVQEGWPYVTYDPREGATLAERLPAKGLAALDAAAWCEQVLQGLAYAHEAGVAHLDLQPFLVLVSDGGQVRLTGLGLSSESDAGPGASGASLQTAGLRQQRAAAEYDVLAAGVLAQHLLSGSPALDESDIGRVIARLPPQGREIVRLPWTLAHPVPEALRAIVNRATDRQERQRYRNARTFLRALEGWRTAESSGGGGPQALLAGKLQAAGVLPSAPGAAARAARLALMDSERTIELAEVVLQDPALAFEMLRSVNSAQVRNAQAAGSGPVLTVRRAIAMLGVEGVRRAALALREWPGPLGEAGAAELERVAERCKHAGRVAVALRQPSYDAEVVYLVTLLQNLGRLVLHYHFADEAQQIRRLTQAAPPARAGEAEEPGMSEEGACFAVLGADVEAIGAAVARWWGLDESVLAMVRRHSPTSPVRNPESDDELLRTVASCANEAVDALTLPQAKAQAALQRVVQRYGRILNFGPKELLAALQEQPGQAQADAAAQTVVTDKAASAA